MVEGGQNQLIGVGMREGEVSRKTQAPSPALWSLDAQLC